VAIKPYKMPDIEAMFKQTNPNQIAPGNAAGIGSGNLLGDSVQTFTMPNFVPDQVLGDDEEQGDIIRTTPDANGGKR
jgi:hypothetical protein